MDERRDADGCRKNTLTEVLGGWVSKYFSDPQVIILALLLLVGFVLIFVLGNMLVPVFAAVVIAYLLEGGVNWLTRAKLPRRAAVVVVFIIFLATMFVLVIWLLPLLSRQVGQLLHELPSMIAAGQKELMRLPERYPEVVSKEQIRSMIQFLSAEVVSYGQRIVSISLASVRGVITLLVYLILVPLLVFFFLRDRDKLMDWIRDLLPRDVGLARRVWHEVNQQISNYVRGKAWEIIIVWVAAYLVFVFLGLRFALLLSFFVGLSVIVPYIGATVMVMPVALIAFFQWGVGADFASVVVAYLILQALDGNLLAPLLLSGVVNLHPIAVIVAVLVFGGLWGIWGLFFAIPLATLVHAVLKAWLSTVRRERGSVEPGRGA
jgi:putative permease